MKIKGAKTYLKHFPFSSKHHRREYEHAITLPVISVVRNVSRCFTDESVLSENRINRFALFCNLETSTTAQLSSSNTS